MKPAEPTWLTGGHLEGQYGVDQAVNALTGKTVTKSIGTPLVAITQQNMNDPTVAKSVYTSSCNS